MTAICIQNSRSLSAGRVHGGRADDTGADSRLEVAANPGLDLRRAAVGLEALEVEAKQFHPLPEVRVVDSAAIGVEGVDHLEEPPLLSRRLGGGVEARRSRVLAGDRKMAKGDRHLALADLLPSGGAMGTSKIGIDDQRLALAAQMVLRTKWGNSSAG
jgi:hypothetical protein